MDLKSLRNLVIFLCLFDAAHSQSRDCYVCTMSDGNCVNPIPSTEANPTNTLLSFGSTYCQTTAVYNNYAIVDITREIAICVESKDATIDTTGTGTHVTCCRDETKPCDAVIHISPPLECWTCSDTQAACLNPTSTSPTQTLANGKCKATTVYTNYVITGLTRENVATCTASKDSTIDSTGSGTDTTCCTTAKCDSVVHISPPVECWSCSDTQAACLNPTSSSPTQSLAAGKCKATAVYTNYVITGLTRENVATCTASKDSTIDSTGSGTDTTCCTTDKCDSVAHISAPVECWSCSDTQAACLNPTSSSPTQSLAAGKCKATSVYTNYVITGLTRENVATCTASKDSTIDSTGSGTDTTCCTTDKCDSVVQLQAPTTTTTTAAATGAAGAGASNPNANAATTTTTTTTKSIDFGPGAGSFAKKTAVQLEQVSSSVLQICLVINALIFLLG